jgi:hypothetical protein
MSDDDSSVTSEKCETDNLPILLPLPTLPSLDDGLALPTGDSYVCSVEVTMFL